MTDLTSGIAVSEGDYIPVIEVNSNDEILGFKVFQNYKTSDRKVDQVKMR